MSYTINYASGVRTDHRGKKFRTASYPNGKVINVPYEEDPNAEVAQTIPVRDEETARREKPLITTGVNGERRDVVHLPKRLAVIHCRYKSRVETAKIEDLKMFEQLLIAMKPMMRSPDCGKSWIPIEPVLYDWHSCYHIDKEVK